jgi:predicted porin
MKKTLLASAIAAATAFSGAAAAAEMPTVYGNIQYVLKHTNVDGAGSTIEHADNGSTLGIKHDHEIAPGITGFFKLELEGINADDKSSSNGIDALDEAYIGVKGDSFGQVWVGSDDSVYESAIVKIGNFHEVGSDIFANYETGEGDLIQYMSPSFGGLTLSGAVQVNGDGDARTGGNKSYPYQLVATYAVDALELSAGMDSNDGSAGVNNENSYGLTATYNMGDFSVIGEYQTRKDVNDIMGVMGVYTMGANQFALSYQVQDDDASGDKNDTIILQALHNVSDNMYVYFEGYLSSADGATYYADPDGTTAGGDEQSIASVGAVYYF